jgi:nicotinate phosphoribosyltransferase
MFHTAHPDEIKKGLITDVYFTHTTKILREKNKDSLATAEICLKSTPRGWSFGILAGIEEAVTLLQGLPIDVWAMPEGALFQPEQPVFLISGKYLDYAIYETALLGLLCQASGIATKAARCKKAAAERTVLSFGARRMHPSLAPMIERNAFIGGCDGVSVVKSGELIKESPQGTIPHALVLLFGDTLKAVRAFDEVIDPQTKRIALIDTFSDEKVEAVRIAEELGDVLYGVRLDTASSRKGNMVKILQEIRWELDLRGYKDIKLFVSGGLDEEEIAVLNEAADGYGVGTAISNAPVVDYSMDIVEIDGKPIAKKGKKSGRKQVLFCRSCYRSQVVPDLVENASCPLCGKPAEGLLKPLLVKGECVVDLPTPQQIRQYVLNQIDQKSSGTTG